LLLEVVKIDSFSDLSANSAFSVVRLASLTRDCATAKSSVNCSETQPTLRNWLNLNFIASSAAFLRALRGQTVLFLGKAKAKNRGVRKERRKTVKKDSN